MSLWKGLSIALVALALIAGGSLFIWMRMAKSSTVPPGKAPAAPEQAQQSPTTTTPQPADSPLILGAGSPFFSQPPIGSAAPGTAADAPAMPDHTAAGASTPSKPGQGTAPRTAQEPAIKLTDEQKAKMSSINTEAQKKVEAISKDAKMSDDEKRTNIFITVQEAQLKVEELLTPEQRKQIEQDMEKRQAAVADRLHLNQEQQKKLNDIRVNANTKGREILRNAALSAKEKETQLLQLQKDSTTQSMDVLTPEQRKQLEREQQQQQEAQKRAAGPTPEDLHMTAEQKAKATAISDNATAKIKALIKDTKLSEAEKKAKILEIRGDCDSQLMKILTPEQQKMLREWGKNSKRTTGTGGKK